MSRKTAREDCFRILFSSLFGKEKLENRMTWYFTETLSEKVDEKDIEFTKYEIEGIWKHQNEIDQLIRNALHGWKLERLSKVDLTILRISVFEMGFDNDVPVRVSINEAVELAKEYSSEAAPAFINGILGTIARIVRPEEASVDDVAEPIESAEVVKAAPAEESAAPAEPDFEKNAAPIRESAEKAES